MNFVANFIRFPKLQNFWKSLKIWQSYRELKGGNFFETQCTYLLTYCALYVSSANLSCSVVSSVLQRCRQWDVSVSHSLRLSCVVPDYDHARCDKDDGERKANEPSSEQYRCSDRKWTRCWSRWISWQLCRVLCRFWSHIFVIIIIIIIWQHSATPRTFHYYCS